MNFKQFLENDENDEDYRGIHKSPTKGSGSPLHDLEPTYPDDIYTLPITTAIQYYGSHHQDDYYVISTMREAHNKPNYQVKIFRAVPDLNKDVDKKIKYNNNLINYVHKFGFPPIKDREASRLHHNLNYDKNKFIEHIYNEIEQLKAKRIKITINPGDWVCLTRSYAKEHGEGSLNNVFKIISKTVPAKHLFTNGDMLQEFGYDPS